MKFYNPFKAHIVQGYNENFYIRKLFITGWKYVSPTGRVYWDLGYIAFCKSFMEEEAARKFLKWLNNHKKFKVL